MDRETSSGPVLSSEPGDLLTDLEDAATCLCKTIEVVV